MNITVSTRERKTLFGGTRYVVNAKIDATPEEAKFCRKTGMERQNLFDLDEVKRWVGDKAHYQLLKRFASFPSRYMGQGMDNEFDDVVTMRNFEGVLADGLKRWKQQVEAHMSQRTESTRTI